MSLDDMSPARIALMNEVAKKVRTAIDKRQDTLVNILQRYDETLEHGDEEQIITASAALMLLSSWEFDSVIILIRGWQEMDEMLMRAERSAERTKGDE